MACSVCPPLAGGEPRSRGLGAANACGLTRSRRAVIAALAGCLARGEATTYGTLRIRSGVAKRTFARALAWAVAAEIVIRTDRGYEPGAAWAACVEGDAETIERVPREMQAVRARGIVPP